MTLLGGGTVAACKEEGMKIAIEDGKVVVENNVSVLTLTISIFTIQYEDGMTWEDWVNSEYNPQYTDHWGYVYNKLAEIIDDPNYGKMVHFIPYNSYITYGYDTQVLLNKTWDESYNIGDETINQSYQYIDEAHPNSGN